MYGMIRLIRNENRRTKKKQHSNKPPTKNEVFFLYSVSPSIKSVEMVGNENYLPCCVKNITTKITKTFFKYCDVAIVHSSLKYNI